MNSVLVEYEKLLKPRRLQRADSANLCLNDSLYPTRSHSIIVECY